MTSELKKPPTTMQEFDAKARAAQTQEIIKTACFEGLQSQKYSARKWAKRHNTTACFIWDISKYKFGEHLIETLVYLVEKDNRWKMMPTSNRDKWILRRIHTDKPKKTDGKRSNA